MRLVRKTRRLTVRPFTVKDFAAWKNAHSKMRKQRNLWDKGPHADDKLTNSAFREKVKGLNQRIKDDVFYDLGVFDNQGALVGGVALMEVARGISHTAFLGYRIFNAYWGLGYGKEAVKAAIDIGFRDIKLHRIEAGIELQNSRSRALARSIGMRREGLKRRCLFLRDKWVDLVMYTLTTEDIRYKFDSSKLKRRDRV
jgi:[ribosomal protein S5]-alanine N-acetyltransferase